MKLYIKSRFSVPAAWVFAVLLVSIIVLGKNHVFLPSFLGVLTRSTPVAVIIACALATLFLVVLGQSDPFMEYRSARKIPWIDSVFISTLTVICFVLAGGVHGISLALPVLRSLCGFTGAGLLAGTLIYYRLGVFLPSILFVIFTLVGSHPGGSGYVWTFAIAPASSVISYAIATIVYISGVWAWIYHYPVASIPR
ncbi:hypothetical protein [Arcanobacterium phocae]|uniref:hypothetical protein n=1 Tax=Arcanobacterium phocae TaxID=131112 RepID=UPI001C0F2B51|nr:hypothetical protein [Arcanobacterium phocae]